MKITIKETGEKKELQTIDNNCYDWADDWNISSASSILTQEEFDYLNNTLKQTNIMIEKNRVNNQKYINNWESGF